jgi:hypothetical protein
MRKCGSPRRVDSKETATARSHGETLFREAPRISPRQEASEPIQVGEITSARAVAAVVVVECRNFTAPRLTQLGWQRSARGDVTRRKAACCRMLGFGVFVSVFEDRFGCRSLLTACGSSRLGE